MAVDIALLSAAPTLGWRMADEALAAQVRAAGRTCTVVRATQGWAKHLKRHPALTDLVEAGAAWHSAQRLPEARAVVISSVTASFFVRPDVPYAIRFDAPAALNRPGLPGAWQRAIEPKVLAKADLLLPWSEEAVEPLGLEAVPLGVPIEPIKHARTRDITAVAYGGNPHKRGVELLAQAWRLPGRLVIGGIDAAQGRAWLARHGVPEPPGLEWAGIIPRADWLELLGRAQLFVQASRFEDHGIAPLEALSAGAKLVSVPTPGPFPALGLARKLAPELIAPERTADALAVALENATAEHPGYAARADALLAPHRPEALQRTVEERVLPRLL